MPLRIERIDDSTVKVVVSAAEFDEWGCNYAALDYSKSETRSIISLIIEEIKAKLGVDLSGDSLYIEAYPYADGGCIMLLKQIQAKPKSERTRQSGFDTPLIYAFSDVNTLCALATRLRTAYNHIIVKDSLYFSEQRREYYLIVYTYFKLDDKLRRLMAEYGKFHGKGAVAQSVVREHCREIISADALLILSRL